MSTIVSFTVCLSSCHLFLLRNFERKVSEKFHTVHQVWLYQNMALFQPKQPDTTICHSLLIYLMIKFHFGGVWIKYFKWITTENLSSERKRSDENSSSLKEKLMFPFGKTVLKLNLWVLLLAELSAICALGIHLVSSTTVRAWGSRPTSFMVISMWQEFFKICTASSWEMLRKLRPLTSRIWSPTYKDGDRETLQMRQNETQQCLAQQRRAHAPQEPVWKSCQQICT